MSILVMYLPYVRTDNIDFGIVRGVPPFGKELVTRLTVCSSRDLSICNFSYFPFLFRGLDSGTNSVNSWLLPIFYHFTLIFLHIWLMPIDLDCSKS